MKAIVINEYEKDFQNKLNVKLAGLAHSEVIDIKFSSTYQKEDDQIVLHAIILHT